MKKTITFLMMLGCISLNAQNSADKFTTGSSDQARDPRVDQINFVPNEVLVKFKDEVPLSSAARLRSAGLSAVDKVLQANGIDSLVRLFPNTKNSLLRSTSVARIVKDPQGRDMKIPNLDKIYKITLPQLRSTSSVPVNIFQVIEDLKALPEVEYAEPNYIYSVDDLKPVGPVLTADDVKKMQSGLRSSQSSVVPNDPLYSQQWYIPAVKADLVWEQTTGDTTQVIAILDTGVDWNHPDLKNKIWTNKDEIPGNGIDDDGNGLIDDIRGWDYINNDNNPMDDNSHGTHVAGIAAAETNNGIGIAGVCPKAKIMPLKVLQSSGRGDAATTSKAIIYAATHGATVLNMSFGSSSNSITMEAALVNAYANCVLVAGAGNDEKSIYISPFYPAAYSCVLGVQADASFSNYDPDGPIFSELEDFNYELTAPGLSIMSTVPNGNYKLLSGTSMATPIVSGAVALYKSKFPERSNEMLWSDIIHSSAMLDVYSTLFNISDKKPFLDLVSYSISDSINGDNDNQADAGETIQLSATIRNTWGQADSVYAHLRFSAETDSSGIQIINTTNFIGAIGTYGQKHTSPFNIKIGSGVTDGRNLKLDVLLWCRGYNDTTVQSINFKITNGRELAGVLDSTLILTPERKYIVNNSFRIGSTGHLILKPGTQLLLNKYIINNGLISGIGKMDSLITISGQCIGGVGELDFQYSSFKNMIVSNNWISYNDYRSNDFSGIGKFSNCTFSDLDGFNNFGGSGPYFFDHCNFQNTTGSSMFGSASTFLDCTFDKIYTMYLFGSSVSVKILNCNFNSISSVPFAYRASGSVKYCNFSNFKGFNLVLDSCNFSNNTQTPIFYSSSGDICNFPNNYWGTTDSSRISKYYIYDFWDSPELALVRFTPFLERPFEGAHGFVWKVLVDGIDPQDQSNLMNPIGVGSHRFDVYFNRPMDKDFLPKVSFGVRLPYGQQMVNENGSWSGDGRIYTVYKTIKLTTGDGINRIRVAEAKENNGWEWVIPVEDSRFEFTISAANSASLEFMATPGLGKVRLEWNNNDIADGLGYNMYRMENINDSTLTSPVMINSTLITDTLYTDFAVAPNKKYYYYYKILRTNLTETDSSRFVSAIPFTASKGDANGDLSVNVLDITTIVAYLLNNNPQPFITEAADMNSDGNINVLDIVGVVNQVLYGGLRSTSAEDQQASLYMQNDTLFADATTAIGGLQFDISGVPSINDIQVLNALQMFESGYSQRDSTTLRLLYYSMSGKSIAAGSRIPLLKLKKDCSLKDVIVSDKAGAAIPVSLTDPTIGNRNGQGRMVAELGQNYPNPSKGQTTLPVQIFEKVDEAAISIYNMLGQQVKVIKLDNPTVGKHEILWNSPQNKGIFVYKLEIRSGGQQYVSPLKKMIVL